MIALRGASLTPTLLVVALALMGCGKRPNQDSSITWAKGGGPPASTESRALAAHAFEEGQVSSAGQRLDVFLTPSDAPMAGEKLARFAPGGGAQGGGGPPAQPDARSAERKIIYTAELFLVVEDFAKTATAVADLVKRFEGYVARSDVNSTQHQQRAGSWTVRIPVAKFDAFLDEAANLGVPETRRTNAGDVTEEFVDLGARLANKREIEKRILKLLEERSGDIKDVIAVETELGRVREEIERAEGRLRYLANMTALTTVTIAAREQQEFQPPQAPTFAAEIGQTFSGSLVALGEAGQGLVLFTVAAGPWLVVLAIVLSPVLWFVRRRFLKRPARA